MLVALDVYSRSARLGPCALVVLPVVLAMSAWFPEVTWTGESILGFLSLTGLTLLFSLAARKHGKGDEAAMWERWGGAPTTQLLRHRDDRLDRHTKGRYHRCLAAMMPETPAPSPAEEASDPAEADARYRSWTKFLIQRTRSRMDFPLVFKELVAYGFVRNLYGMRNAARTTATLGTVGAASAVAWMAQEGWQQVNGWSAVATLLNALLLSIWLISLRETWVKSAAFEYAEALLSSCDLIAAKRSAAAEAAGH